MWILSRFLWGEPISDSIFKSAKDLLADKVFGMHEGSEGSEGMEGSEGRKGNKGSKQEEKSLTAALFSSSSSPSSSARVPTQEEKAILQALTRLQSKEESGDGFGSFLPKVPLHVLDSTVVVPLLPSAKFGAELATHLRSLLISSSSSFISSSSSSPPSPSSFFKSFDQCVGRLIDVKSVGHKLSIDPKHPNLSSISMYRILYSTEDRGKLYYATAMLVLSQSMWKPDQKLSKKEGGEGGGGTGDEEKDQNKDQNKNMNKKSKQKPPIHAKLSKVLVWCHATTGIQYNCAPSNLSAELFLGSIPGVAKFLAEGYVILAPDYLGLGLNPSYSVESTTSINEDLRKYWNITTPPVHPYLIGKPLAKAVCHAIQAVCSRTQTENPWQLPSDVILFGHSEGGYAVIWTAKLFSSLLGKNCPEVKLQGSVVSAPATDLSRMVEAKMNTVAGKIISSYGIYSWVKYYAHCKTTSIPSSSSFSSSSSSPSSPSLPFRIQNKKGKEVEAEAEAEQGQRAGEGGKEESEQDENEDENEQDSCYKLKVKDIIHERYIPVTKRISESCVLTFMQTLEVGLPASILSNSWYKKKPTETPGWKELLLENTPDSKGLTGPMLFVQGNLDDLVPPDITRNFVYKIVQSGNTRAVLAVYNKCDHFNVTSACLGEVLSWIQKL